MMHPPTGESVAASRKLGAAVIFNLITILFTVLTYDLGRGSVTPFLGIPFLMLTYAALAIVAFQTQSGIYTGFQNIATVTAYFAFGPLGAAIVAFIGAGLAELGQFFFFQRSEKILFPIGKVITTWLINAGLSGYSILVAGWLFIQLNGQLPLRSIELQLFPDYAIFFIGRAALYGLPIVLFFSAQSRMLDRRQSGEVLTRFLLIEVFAMPLALLLAAAYNNAHIGTFLVGYIGMLVLVELFRLAENSQRTLERRIDELSMLNRIGQSISSNLSLPDLMENIYSQVTQLMKVPTFYIALYDAETQLLTFALAAHEGKHEHWEPRQAAKGITEYILRSARPLLLSGAPEEVDKRLVEMGVERLERPAVCFLGVPLVADRETIGVIAAQSNNNPYAFGPSELALLSTVAAQAAISLHNSTLYHRVYEMADKLALLNNVSSVITASLDLDKVLNTICAVVIEVGYADKTGIFLAAENGTTLRLARSIGLSEDYVAQFQEIVRNDDSGPMQVMRQTQVMAIADVHNDPRGRGWRTLAEVEGYVGLLTVPLIASDQVIGFLAAFYQQPHVFSKSELDLMNTLANQVAVAVANARLHNDTQARARELSRLVDASRGFTATLDLEKVAQQVFDELDDLIKPDAFKIALLDGNSEFVPLLERGIPLPLPRSFVIDTDSSPRSITHPRDSGDLAALHRLGIQSLHTFPLVSQEKPFGVVLVAHKVARRFTTRERQLVEAMVNQAAIAIRNAQLFRQVDIALEDRVAELSAIEAISRKISGVLDLDTIITDVLATARAVTQADLCSAALKSSDPENFSLIEISIEPDNATPQTRTFPLRKGIIGRVLRTGEIARVGDVRHDPDYVVAIPDILSELCVPIVHKGERVGAINVESRRINAFTLSHERFLLNLAEHAAIAIGNAQLFEERQRQIETLTRLRNLSLELLLTSTLKQVMSLIVEAALAITKAKDVHLYTYDKAKDTLVFGASLWKDGRVDVEATPPSAHGRTYQVARSGQMYLIPDMSKVQPPIQFRDGMGYNAIARIPLKRADKVLGVIVLAFDEPTYFNDNDIRVLDLLAGQTAIAIENARLLEELRTNRDRMQVILDSARDGMILIDKHSTLALANRAAEKLLGYPLHHFQGQHILRLAARAEREVFGIPNLRFWMDQIHDILAAIKKAPNEPTERTFEVQDSGTARNIEETTLPVFDDAGQMAGRLVVLRDVTQENELRHLQEEVSDMLVHDLRGPLTGVISSLRLMDDMLKMQEYEDVPTVLDIALTSSSTQLRMIDSLMDIRKWRTGRMPLNPTAVSLSKVADKVVASLTAVANEASVRMVNLVASDFPSLCVDEDLISRVVFNLLDNALRHTPSEGEVRVEARLVPAEEGTTQTKSSDQKYEQIQKHPDVAQSHMALISVTDTGRGVPPEARERIFELFVQVPKTALRGHRGSGLGLTFCRLTVEAHGGKIWVSSGPEGGASFTFTLPVMAEKPPQTAAEPTEVNS